MVLSSYKQQLNWNSHKEEKWEEVNEKKQHSPKTMKFEKYNN